MVEFKCKGIRSDTPNVASSRRTFLGSMIGAAVLPSVPGPPVRPGRWLSVPAPRVPVAGAVLRPLGEGLARLIELAALLARALLQRLLRACDGGVSDGGVSHAARRQPRLGKAPRHVVIGRFGQPVAELGSVKRPVGRL